MRFLVQLYWLWKTRRHDKECPLCRGDYEATGERQET